MVRHASLLSQILGFIPRLEFAEVVRKHGAERHSKGFSSWAQCVSMLFCQLGQAYSIREIVGGLGSMPGKSLGLKGAPKRPILSYANAHRPWQVYQDVFYNLLDRGSKMVRDELKHPLRFKNPLFSMDATVIDLCLSIFPWAEFRQTKGAVKLNDDGVSFVTRAKDNISYEIVEERRIPQNRNIVADKVIELASAKGRKACPHHLRLVEMLVEETGETLVFLTNNLKLGATTIAGIYRERWKIELFFKALKQNLRIKTFVGTTRNALYTQIWTAVILHHSSRYQASQTNSAEDDE